VDLDGLNGDDTTLTSLAAALGGVPGLSANVTPDNRLSVTAGAGQEMWFSEDSSGALAALGVGTFFTGTSAGDIAVNAAIQADPRLIAASLSGEVGDGGNAGRLALAGTAVSTLLGGQTIESYHATTINRLAVEGSAALTSYEASDAVYSALVAQRESISGVSLDEEAINLTKFERAYQGAARYLGVIDNLSNEVLGLVG
jgi:flagellar hook-associated protein 1 FlgK